MKEKQTMKWFIFISTIIGIILSGGVAFGVFPEVYFKLVPIFWCVPAGISGGNALAEIIFE